ncbi:MAG: Asp23/Gls24 family envelope stress response protein [Candidatus Ratteibacteria bacterium]
MIEEKKELGKVKIDNDVLASIAGIAALKVNGVSGIATSFLGGIARFLKKTPDIGIKVILGEGEVSFELGIVVEYGVNIPEITYEVQKKIKEEVEKMSGLVVSNVDVIVKEVKPPKKEKE